MDSSKEVAEALRKLEHEEQHRRDQKRLLKLYRKRKQRILAAKLRKNASVLIQKAKAAYTPRRAVMAGVLGLVVIAGLWGLTVDHYKQAATKRNPGQITADFNPVVPNDKINPVTSENNNFKIVSYQDDYQGTALIVSQQKLPEQFSKDPSAIKTLDQFKTADEIDTSKGKLYVTTNKTSQQWGAMVYGNILLFIQTSKTLTDQDWSAYISDLQVK